MDELVLDGDASPMTPVQMTGDLRRIMALPTKEGVVIPDLTERYKTPSGTMKLFPIQSEALFWAERFKGLIGLVAAGEGKTLVSLLLGKAVGASKTVLMIPPALRHQLLQEDLPELLEHWQIDLDTLHIVPYSMLSQADFADVLEKLDPDLVVFDEGHMIRSLISARGRRLRRFLAGRKKRGKLTRLCYLSGTLTNDGLEDYGQACAWALGEGSPLPLIFPTRRDWAEALDPVEPGKRRPYGALWKLCRGTETPPEGFCRRLLSTPGVVVSSELSVPCSLKLWPWSPRVSLKAFREVSATWTRPDGKMFDDMLSLFRVLRQVLVGFYYYEDWPGGKEDVEWVEAGKEWQRVLRDTLRRKSHKGFDSPFLVKQAAMEGRWSCPEWERWALVRDRIKPQKAACWLDDTVVNGAVEWGQENIGIIWYMHEEVGRRIAELGGFPVFWGGMNEELAQEDGSRTIVASVRAHGTGKNLQMFAKNLSVEPISSNKRIEQLIARTHRKKQEADEVEFWYPTYSWLHDKALARAKRQAEYVVTTTKQPQRLYFADWCEEDATRTRHTQEHEADFFDALDDGQQDLLMEMSEED